MNHEVSRGGRMRSRVRWAIPAALFLFYAIVAAAGGPHTPPDDYIYGDSDYDGDVDLHDFGVFVACFNGPNRWWTNLQYRDPDRPELGLIGPDCGRMDYGVYGDGPKIDGDVDLDDFAGFQHCFNGENRPPPADCWRGGVHVQDQTETIWVDEFGMMAGGGTWLPADTEP